MNKTLSVNIGGIVFHIEEQAYDRLNKYLDSIKGYFTTSDGRDEIIQDIEARLGEMFQERISGGKQVIVEADVEHVIGIMGKPEQFIETGEEPASAEEISYTVRRSQRRLFRDPDDRVIGGVCSGISHYLGIDPLWLRLAFAIAFFAFGSGLLLYIILMIIMPKALTTAEKLEMKGEKVNISNIKKSVQEEMDSLKSSYEKSGAKRGIASFFDALGQLFVALFRFIGKIIAAFFVVIGVIILAAFVMAFLALLGIGSVSIPFVMTGFVMEPWQQALGLLGAFLVLGIPVIAIIYKAIKVLFKIRSESRVLNWTAFALWIVGLGVSFLIVASMANEFRVRESERSDISIIQPPSDTLIVGVNDNFESRYDWYFGRNARVNVPWSASDNTDSIRISDVKLDIIKARGDKFELVQMATSCGSDRKEAFNNARAINYNMEQEGNLMRFDDAFTIEGNRKYRGQKLQLILKVPVGKHVFLTDDADKIIYDIRNVTNTYDGDMIGKTWTMTERGLECIGCNLEKRNDDFHIRINEKGVKIHGYDSESDSTINIKGEDVNIKIDDEGVQIDARKK